MSILGEHLDVCSHFQTVVDVVHSGVKDRGQDSDSLIAPKIVLKFTVGEHSMKESNE